MTTSVIHQSLPPETGGGATRRDYRHGQRPTLELIVGELDSAVWRPLTPDDEVYELFLGPALLQAQWNWRTHLYFWETHLRLWPRDGRKLSTSGLIAQRVAIWRREGYSRTQVARTLGYVDKNGGSTVPRSVWDLADTYRDWLAERPFMHPQGLAGARWIEDLLADSHAARDESRAALAVRRNYREFERTPRVVTAEERTQSAFSYFGHPEHISTTLLDELKPERRMIRARLEHVGRELQRLDPAGEPRRAPRRRHETVASVT